MNRFVTELDNLSQDLMKMGALVEQQLDSASQALAENKLALAREVIKRDNDVDEVENAIIEQTIKLLATFQPVAADLRFLSTTQRMAMDLERVADLSVNLCWRVVAMNEEVELKAPISPLLPQMAIVAASMMSQAMDAFAARDEAMAVGVLHRDDELDDLNRQHRAVMIELMQKRPELVPWGVEAINASSHLERIGDHVTNLAEEVVYLVKGLVLRHCALPVNATGITDADTPEECVTSARDMADAAHTRPPARPAL